MNRKLFASVAAAGLLLTACSSGSGGAEGPSTAGGNNPGPEPGADGCTPVVVATSSEKVNMMEELGAVFKESPQAEALDGCASVLPINVTSGKGAQILATSPTAWPDLEEAYWPTIWSPASTIWTDRVDASGASIITNVESFTRTPVVLGMPESMAEALGYPNDPVSLEEIEALVSDPEGWGSVGKPLWGSFKIAKTNPNTSTTGLSMILMQSYAATGKDADLTPEDVTSSSDFSQAFEAGAIHYGDTTGNVLTTLYNASRNSDGGSSYVSAIALEETSLFNYNKGNPDSHTVQPGEVLTPPAEKLVAIYPEEGSLWSDNPAALITAQWVSAEEKAAGEAFLEFLKTKEAQEVLPKYGFRPVDESVDVSAHMNAEVGIDPARPAVTLPKPDPSTVSAAIDLWAQIRKPSAVIQVIDVSGSMNDPAGDGNSKLESAIVSAQSTLDNFRSTDELGVWVFTTGISSDLGENVVPVREFAPLAGDKEALTQSLDELRNAKMSGTPLYDAIGTAYDYMSERAEPGRINALVVLSDGADTDSSTSLESLLVKINSSNTEGGNDSPVRIFTIAYGEGANLDTLRQISTASGGQTFNATDPSRIAEVFRSVMNNF